MNYSLGEETPNLKPTAWVAPTACLIGRVTLEAEASIWFGAVLRGDNEAIRVGARSNVQDGVVIHTDPGFPCSIGEATVVGHRAVLHGCQIGNRCLIGIGAIVLNGAVIPDDCILGAGALVGEGKVLESGFLYVGIPARKVRELKPEELAGVLRNTNGYVDRAGLYLSNGIEAPKEEPPA